MLSELVRHYDPRLADADGRTALMDAAWSCRLFSAEDRAEESFSIQCLKILLPLSDPTAQTSTGLTALMCAGSAQAATILLSVSEPKAADDRGRTALMHAVQGNRPRVVEALLSSSNVNAVSEAGATALDFALGYCWSSLIPLMMSVGALIVPINSASAAFLPQRELTARHD